MNKDELTFTEGTDTEVSENEAFKITADIFNRFIGKIVKVNKLRVNSDLITKREQTREILESVQIDNGAVQLAFKNIRSGDTWTKQFPSYSSICTELDNGISVLCLDLKLNACICFSIIPVDDEDITRLMMEEQNKPVLTKYFDAKNYDELILTRVLDEVLKDMEQQGVRSMQLKNAIECLHKLPTDASHKIVGRIYDRFYPYRNAFGSAIYLIELLSLLNVSGDNEPTTDR